MKILLLGKTGQVGTELQRALLPLGTLVALSRQDICLSELDKLNQFLLDYKPNLIVNAAAYTAVDKAESQPSLADLINHQAVNALAQYAKNYDALLIHYSTDYVFDGNKSSPYLETDRPCPLNIYGSSKWAGEQAISESGCRYFILRTSWVFSSQGNNFLKTILNLAKHKSTLNVISDQIGAPTSAELIADVTALLILNEIKKPIPYGIYHLTASGKTSWHGFACEIIQYTEQLKPIFQLKSDNIFPISSQQYSAAATRPKNSLLSTARLTQTLGVCMPDWNVYVHRALHQLHNLGFIHET